MTRVYIRLLLLLALVVVPAAPARAEPPPLPSSFYGAVTLDGADVPAGTLVTAWIEGVQYAQAATKIADGHSIFTVNVPADDPATPVVEGGRNNQVVVFRVAGKVASPTGIWNGGTYTRLDLAA